MLFLQRRIGNQVDRDVEDLTIDEGWGRDEWVSFNDAGVCDKNNISWKPWNPSKNVLPQYQYSLMSSCTTLFLYHHSTCYVTYTLLLVHCHAIVLLEHY
jgi:hypothetical protein